jgi:F-type H+-transporting ATPase subunit delta
MSVASNRYAKALVDALYPASSDAGLKQLQTFSRLLKDEPDARRMFENPAFAGDRRKKFLDQLAGSLGFDRRLTNFLNLLIDRNRLVMLDQIVDAYQKLLDERLGVVRAVVTAAQPLEAAERSQLAAQLERVTGKKVSMEVAVDPSLIGGVVAQVGSTVYDGSVRQQLQAFKHRLIEK